MVMDFIAGTANVPEAAFALGNAARSAVSMETALKAESNALRAQLNNRQWEKSMGKMEKSLGRTKGAGRTEPPVAIPEQFHQVHQRVIPKTRSTYTRDRRIQV
jgi:hypothetical protein